MKIIDFFLIKWEIKIKNTKKDSAIIDFYPEDFQIDLNGKKQAWQGVALLPFVDEQRLKDALKPVYNKLTVEESMNLVSS